MSGDPVLVIQMHRLGDIILTFPLLMYLQKLYAGCPVWVVAEPVFFSGLLPFSPNAVFYPPSHLPVLAQGKYSAVINLDSSREASICAGKADAGLKLGLVRDRQNMAMRGFWQLYRASLTRNNRHNLYHWADLNILDLGFPAPGLFRPTATPPGNGRIGLFTGASEPAKRPDIIFWVNLVRRLAADGFKPVLLGGPAEKNFGKEIASRTNLQNANFCGKTSIAQLAELVKTLDLLITPDTGPMHLADWLGTPVLNISMGNVSAPETGPVSPGQIVMVAAMSCSGCWQCWRPKLYCRMAFNAGAVARAAKSLVTGENLHHLPGLKILRSGRDMRNLHSLEPVMDPDSPSCRDYLDKFWQCAFLNFYDAEIDSGIKQAAAALQDRFPLVTLDMRKTFASMLSSLSACIRSGTRLPEAFWSNQPGHSRILSGHMQMSLQNENFSRPAILQACGRLAMLQELFAATS